MKKYYFDTKKVYKYLSESILDNNAQVKVNDANIDINIYNDDNDEINRYWITIDKAGELELDFNLDNHSIKEITPIVNWINNTLVNCIFSKEENDD